MDHHPGCGVTGGDRVGQPYAAAYTSNQDRQATLPGWLHAYNHHRPHSALNGRSPINTLNNVPENHN